MAGNGIAVHYALDRAGLNDNSDHCIVIALIVQNIECIYIG